jgi:hypothetical protein
MQSNVNEGVLFADPTSEKGREKVANSCVRNLHIAITTDAKWIVSEGQMAPYYSVSEKAKCKFR